MMRSCQRYSGGPSWRLSLRLGFGRVWIGESDSRRAIVSACGGVAYAVLAVVFAKWLDPENGPASTWGSLERGAAFIGLFVLNLAVWVVLLQLL